MARRKYLAMIIAISTTASSFSVFANGKRTLGGVSKARLREGLHKATAARQFVAIRADQPEALVFAVRRARSTDNNTAAGVEMSAVMSGHVYVAKKPAKCIVPALAGELVCDFHIRHNDGSPI